jgi:phosphoribosylformylglycinamidine cyclo-ligase
MGGLLEEELLKPTRLYLPLAQGLAGLGAGAMAHITGGGLPGNAARTLPRHLDMVLDTGRWPQPPIYAVMARAGVSRDELLATFNMGIGFTVAMAPDLAQEALRLCERAGIPAWQIGRLVPGTGKVKIDG